MDLAARKAVPWFYDGALAGGPRLIQRGLGAIRKQARKDGLRLRARPIPNANFAWSDLNSDGGVDPDEIRYFATPGLTGPLPPPWKPEAWSGGVVGDDLAIYLTAIQDDQAHHYRLPVSRWTEDSVPIYDPDKAELIASSPYMGQAAWLSAEGNLLTLGNMPGKGRPHRQRDPLVMYRPDGTVAWTYPSPWTGVHGSHTAPKERRGQLIGPLGVLGNATLDAVGEIFAFHTNVGTAEFFTADGLYLGRIFRDTRSVAEPWPDHPRRGQSLKQMTNGGEWFGGQLLQRPDGKIFVVASRQAGVIGEVIGLDTTRRLDARPLTFTTDQYEGARQLLNDATAGERPSRSIKVAKLRGTDGKAPSLTRFRWDADHAARWRYDETRSAKASWGWDESHLYVAFQVDDDTPMINGGEDARRLFKFGDAAILELRTDPTQQSTQAAPGDLRLLFSVHLQRPVAVLYDYRNPAAETPVEFTSVKATRIDRVEVIEDAAITVERDGTGYTLRAAVPLKALNDWKPEPGRTYAGDLAIVYSDKTGSANVLRMHWSNKATGIVSDLSVEADIQPALWGRFNVQEKTSKRSRPR
jgi:hypothetical protein